MQAIARLRFGRTPPQPHDEATSPQPDACSWNAMRDVYAEQAARGVPEAIRGLERIDQGRWPTSGRPRRGR